MVTLLAAVLFIVDRNASEWRRVAWRVGITMTYVGVFSHRLSCFDFQPEGASEMLACFHFYYSCLFLPASSPLVSSDTARIVGPSHEFSIRLSDHHMGSHAMLSS